MPISYADNSTPPALLPYTLIFGPPGMSKFPLLLFLLSLAVPAQDQVEIQIYEYETVPQRMWNLETHLNFIGHGAKEFDGPMTPTNSQFHMTYARADSRDHR